jgi:hypothetical protein
VNPCRRDEAHSAEICAVLRDPVIVTICVGTVLMLVAECIWRFL